VRTLRERIDSMLYERSALSRKPDDLVTLLHTFSRNDFKPPFIS
jgi:predicted nuclease of restriction endonuclease-like (RecB) superfamily